MSKRLILLTGLLLLGLSAGLLSVIPLVYAQDQPDPTVVQATVDALVAQRFQQTLEAQQAQQPTPDIEASAQAAFDAALTATADAIQAEAADDTDAVAPLAEVGGLQVVFTAEGEPGRAIMRRAGDVMLARLATLGINAADVQVTRDSITLTLLGADANQDVLDSLRETGLLEFVDFSGLNDQIDDFTGARIITTAGEDQREAADQDTRDDARLNPLTDEPFETVVTGADIIEAEARQDPNLGAWTVVFQFSEAAGQFMFDYTDENIGEPLAIVLDGEVLSIPVIQSAFGPGGGLITGSFTQAEAERLALQLNAGALPVTLAVESVTQVSAAEIAVAPTTTPTLTPSFTPTPSLTPTFDPRPTATRGEIQVAEQVFEGGRMFWVQPTGQIWVMFGAEGEDGSGEWGVYEDTFEEGEPETDPGIVPPEGFFQPERGFGKLWRGNEELREALGWAVTPEFGYTSDYYYQPGGEMVDGTLVPGPGYHVLFTLYEEAIRFNEGDNTWELNDGDDANAVRG